MILNCKSKLVKSKSKMALLGMDLNNKLYLSTINLVPHDLVIVSNEKIVPNNWAYHQLDNELLFVKEINFGENLNDYGYKKVVAASKQLTGVAIIPHLLLQTFISRHNSNKCTDIDIILSEKVLNKLCDRQEIRSYLFKEEIDKVLSERNKVIEITTDLKTQYPLAMDDVFAPTDYDNTIHHGDDM